MSKSTTRVQSGKNSIYIIGTVVIAAALLLWLVWRAQPAQDNTTTSNEQNAQVQISQTQNDVSESQPAQAEAALPVQSEVAAVGTVGTEVGDIAPDFTVSTISDNTFTLSNGQGKPTIMLFMAYWCGTCLGEARALTQLQQEYGDQLNIMAIDVDPSSTPELLGQFKSAAGDGNYIWAIDTGQKVTTAYQVTTLDTTLILDAQGRVVYRDQYPTPYQPLKNELAKLGL